MWTLCRRLSSKGFGACLAVLLAVLFAGGIVHAGVTASISGTVTDASGAIVVGATVTAINVDTGVTTTQTTNAQGFYSFQSLPLGNYRIEVQQEGFKAYSQTGLVLDVNQALVVDVKLVVGQTTERVEVSSSALHVDTQTTQMGEVITAKEMTDVPLVSRSYTDLLALQPGVISQASQMTGAYAGPFVSATFAAPLVSGSLDSGGLSVNGMREAANGFILNGMLVQETGFSGAGAIPNLDSIAEFRILTNNYDAEYGNYSGGQINVVTKSGTNQYHGNLFEFLRNTDFDAANYFAAGQRGAYHQNQFGGTFGGPIKRDKIFFFVDYQGNRLIQATTQLIVGAPSAATESGNLSGVTGSLTGNVNGAGWAESLTKQLGYSVRAGEPYYTSGCTSNTQCVLPNAYLSPSAFNPISTNLLHYILPATPGTINPSTGTGTYSNSSEAVNLTDNKTSGRLDANTSYGLLSAYYYYDNYNRTDPYWSSPGPLYPGFAVGGFGTTDTVVLGDTKTFSSASVNEFRLGYFRLDTRFNQPKGGKATLASLGFASGANGAPGIYVGAPDFQGVPEIDFNNFSIGVPSHPNGLIENVYQIADNYSKVIGTHTVKVGGAVHFNRLEEDLVDNTANGNFYFGGSINAQPSETGSDFVDFLLGAPSQFIQGQSYISYGRSYYLGLYGQDSWRVKPNLTFNYGLRWDVSSPWKEKNNQIQTLIPGEQSIVFQGSPRGWVFPGDPGVPPTLAPTRWNNFAPRLGLAYSFGDHQGMLGKILGKPGDTSLRVGWGMFYTALEGATGFNEIGDAPFGNYASLTTPSTPSFASPFIPRAAGNCAPNSSCTNLFPAPNPPLNFSANNPATGYPYTYLADWYTAFGTISSAPGFYYKNRLPYAENYELSIEHQITRTDLLTISYVGTQGHRLLSSESSNPGNPQACLGLNAATLAPTNPTTGMPQAPCGPSGENTVYYLANGQVVPGTRKNFPGVILPNGTPIVPLGNNAWFITAGVSAYNSAQISYRHTSDRLQLLLGYTFSKALDNSSGYGEQFNPYDPKLSRGLSAFNQFQNFVVSYTYQLPLDKLGGPKRLTNGWAISGITRFATGLPVTIVETDDQSLQGTASGGPIPLPADTPNLSGMPLDITNPRKTGGRYFSPLAFEQAGLGQEGTANRRFFGGPGINNWDLALLKNTGITEHVNLQFRAEFFNIGNHTQFLTPGGITGFTSPAPGAVSSSSFGYVPGAASPRIGQLSLKLNF